MTKSKITNKKKLRKKKEIPQSIVSTDIIFKTILTGSYPVTADRMMISKALSTLRGLEIRKDEKAEMSLLNAYRQCRETVLKTIIKAIVDNNMRLVDGQIIMEMIAPEIVILSAWEYEHLDEADKMITPTIISASQRNAAKSALEILKTLDGNACADEGDDLEDTK
jgi:hypothetical protein